jgi:hypothetical protein
LGPIREELRYALKFDFASTNNEVEYEAVFSTMEIAQEMRIMNMEIRSDSRVVVEQVNGSYAAQEARMSQYLEKVHQFYSHFDRVVLTKIPREENGLVDALSRIGLGTDPAVSVGGCRVLIKARPTVSSTEEVMQISEVEPEWATGVIRYLKMGELPSAKEEAREVIRHSAHYVLVGGTLYRRGYSLPLLKCLPNEDADYVLREIHHGVCRNHSGAKALANKVIRAGYYWLTMNKDTAELVRACDACQIFVCISKNLRSIFTQLHRLGRSLNGGSTSSAQCRRAKVIRGLWWLESSISLNGPRPRHLQRSQLKMSSNFYGSR